MVFFGGGAYGSLPDAAIWWCLRTGGGGIVSRKYSNLYKCTDFLEGNRQDGCIETGDNMTLIAVTWQLVCSVGVVDA